MRFELFVALRYLFARRKEAFIYIISTMSVLGVAIGVASLVVVLGVYNGFTTDIRDRILGANAHIIITGPLAALAPASVTQGATDTRGIGLEATLSRITSTPGVIGAMPFLYAEGMLSSARGVKGVVLRGIDPKTAPQVLSMLNGLTSGSVNDLEPGVPGAPPGVLVGKELAQRLGIETGSRVNLLSPAGQKTAAGFQPRIRPYKVAGIFQTGMFEYDSSLGFVSLQAGRDLLGLPEDRISGVEVTVENVYKADVVAETLKKELGPLASVRTWMDMNANLFAALKLEKIGMFILLAMVVLVGSFSIVTTLVMLVMEKTRDIAILMSMGATRSMVRRVFMLQGTIIGVVGTLLGYVLGVGVALLLQRYQFIKLPPGVYALDHLPVLLDWVDILIVGVSAMTLCFLATIYPARQAASLEPAEALRYE
ncbi:MAG: lipoprotein-releasing ABC transporter permease subunit [Bilophila sp.]